MYASRIDSIPPKGYDNGLMALHERKPFPYSVDLIRRFAVRLYYLTAPEKTFVLLCLHKARTLTQPKKQVPILLVWMILLKT